MFKAISQEIRNQIIGRIKTNGETVSQLAAAFSVSPKTIYGWLRDKSTNHVNFLEYARLKRENKLLLEIVGRLTLERSQTGNLKKS